METNLSKEQLLNAYDELNSVVGGIKPPIVWKNQNQFEKELWATIFVDNIMEEGDEVSDETQSVFDILNSVYGDGEEQEDKVREVKQPAPEAKKESKPKAEKPAPKPVKEPEPVVEKEEPEEEIEVDMEKIRIRTRTDAVCLALKVGVTSIDDWSRKADSILEMKGGKIKPNNLSNRFIIGYIYELAEHFDLGTLPKS